MKDDVEIGSIVINNDYRNEFFKKQMTVDFNSPYLGLDDIDEIRKTLIKKIKSLTKNQNHKQ